MVLSEIGDAIAGLEVEFTDQPEGQPLDPLGESGIVQRSIFEDQCRAIRSPLGLPVDPFTDRTDARTIFR